MFSFGSGQPVSLTTKQHQAAHSVPAFDPTLNFNKPLDQGRGDPDSITYSIDPGKIQKVIKSDDLAELYKITLACRPTATSLGMWDVLINSGQYRTITACVLVAQHDFTPIPKNRIISSPQFLTLSRPISRLHLNQLEVGDRVGIALSDRTTGYTHVLLYVVEDLCSVRRPGEAEGSVGTLIPAVNVVMEHAIQIDHSNPGNAVVLNMGEEEYNHDQARPFVEWLSDSVFDIPHAYSWKPHFLPFGVSSVKPDEVAEKLVENLDKYKPSSFEDFEVFCRQAYEKAKRKKEATAQPAPQPRQPGQKRKNRPNQPNQLPVMQVFSVGNEFYAGIMDDDARCVKLTLDDLGNHAITERHLVNRDLAGKIIAESSDVVPMKIPAISESEGYLRYFTLNF